MGTSVWKLNAIKRNGRLEKGMSVEIFQTNSVNKPPQKLIAEKINEKYNTKIDAGSCGYTNFEISKLS
ncbi:hypothetical protein [Gillisia sp. JM1]|jgi:hypothetical protein|uniref:hypothetical protein n=1 Tax=Gillisia sp. JM1 TaxID=1283286 RepID=UPI0004136FB3|nr:hypothetical protein [Gillisia sp. JM1]